MVTFPNGLPDRLALPSRTARQSEFLTFVHFQLLHTWKNSQDHEFQLQLAGSFHRPGHEAHQPRLFALSNFDGCAMSTLLQAILYYTILYYTVLNYIVLYRTVLYCTVPYYTYICIHAMLLLQSQVAKEREAADRASRAGPDEAAIMIQSAWRMKQAQQELQRLKQQQESQAEAAAQQVGQASLALSCQLNCRHVTKRMQSHTCMCRPAVCSCLQCWLILS